MAIIRILLDPDATSYTDDEIVGKVNSAAVNISRAGSVLAAARPIAAGEVGATELENEAFLAAEKSKLEGVDEGAKDDQTGAEIKTAYEAEENAYTDTKDTKLTSVEADAKDDQTGAEIKTAYEVETGAYTDIKDTKLSAIEENAKDDQTNEEVRDLIIGLPDLERKIIVTDPEIGEFKVIAVQADVDGKVAIDKNDVAEV